MQITRFILLFLTLISCRKQPIEQPVEPFPPKDTLRNFEIVWMVPVKADTTTTCIANDPCLVGTDLMYVNYFCGGNDVVQLLDGATGQRKWSQSKPTVWGEGDAIGSVASWNDLGLICSWDEIYALRQSNGQTVWSSDVGSGSGGGEPRIKVIGDYVYHCHRPDGNNVASAHLVRSLAGQGSTWDTLFSAYREENDGYSPDFEMPSIWQTPQGDTLLIFQNRQTRFGNSDGKIDLYALNLRTRAVVWKVSDLTPEGYSITDPPLIWQDKIFFVGTWRIFCLDAASGHLLWTVDNSSDPINHFSHIRPCEHAGYHLLIAESGDGLFYAFNMSNGSQVWKTATDWGWSQPFAVLEDRIYATGSDGLLICINAFNGKLVWQEAPPARQLGFSGTGFTYGGVLIKPDRRFLYVNDGIFWYCLKLL